MSNLIRKKVILCLLYSDPKSADEIANKMGESLETVDDQLTTLVSEAICEKVSQDEISPYAVKKDIPAFAKLVKEFLSNPEEHKQETEQFITSEYYLTRFDYELVDYVLSRFHLDSVYQTDRDKEKIRRILLVSPSALNFALHDDTTSFHESWVHWNRLGSSDATRDWLVQILCSRFETPLSERLIADSHISPYSVLYTKLQIRVAKINIQVGLATVDEKYVEVMGSESYGFYKLAEGPRPRNGALVSLVDPIDASNDGLAFLHLGEFQDALTSFDYAFDQVKDSSQKAIVLNNKGLAFLNFKQYQKAIECFEEGMAFDSDDAIPELRENKQIAGEYLARATDADNLTEPTQIRFIQGAPVPFEETRFYEFKEIKSRNPVRSIIDTSDIYTVAFLNREGGRIFWGIRDDDRITIGVKLDEQAKDDIRAKVSNKLCSIRPSINPEDWQLEFHNIYGLQGEIVEDLWVIELLVLPQQRRDVFYTGKGDLFVKTEGGRQKLLGPEVTEFIRRYFQSETETD